MVLRLPTENETSNFVMPAWIAVIQGRGMRPETSRSAWISVLDAGIMHSRTGAPSLVFSQHAKSRSTGRGFLALSLRMQGASFALKFRLYI